MVNCSGTPLAITRRVTRQTDQRGFSMVEMLIVVAVMGIIAIIALPNVFRTTEEQRLRNDGRSIAQMVGVVKMTAASKFTRARLFVVIDDTNPVFYMQYWDKPNNRWCHIGIGNCLDASEVTRLSQGVRFGFLPLDTAPNCGPPRCATVIETQPVIKQSEKCTNDAGAEIGNTACIVFNSRGIPVVPATGEPTGDNAIYLTQRTNAVGVFGVTLTATPLVRLWWSPANTAAWVPQ